MFKKHFSKFIPHIVAVFLFIIISFIYMKPVLEDKQLLGHDTQSWMCMAKETIEYNETHDDTTLWTNSMFGGMPNYQISMHQHFNLLKYVEDALRVFPNTVFYLILYLFGFYILMLNFRLNPWLAIIGSIAFTFASYNFIIIAAGHNSKAITIAYMAPLIGSVFVTFRRNKIMGSLLTAFFLSLAIRANHIQILYYTLIIILIFGIVELVYSIKEKQIKAFIQASLLALAAAAIALGMNATGLLTTNEYSKHTMRGESNGLTIDTQSSQQGLNRDYITQWSYGKAETFTLLIPNFYGGASGTKLSDESHTAKAIQERYGAGTMKQIMNSTQFPTYWGTQPFTSGPVYIGAIVIFLFILGLFIVDKRTLWWLVPMIVLTLLLSWGRNFQWFTDLFIDYFPLYNKFRTVSMILVATGFGMTLIAILALKEIIYPSKHNANKLIKPLLISTAISAGIALMFAIIPALAGSFTANGDIRLAQQFSNATQADFSFLTDTLAADRKAMLRADAFRSLVFIIAAAGILFLFLKGKLKQQLVIAFMAVLMLLDLVPVAKRYLNDDNFGAKKNVHNLMKPSPADQYIMEDKDEFRILNLTVNVFNDASPSYFHKNIGGYHAAKLRRYQELINLHLTTELEQFGQIRSFEDFDSIMPNQRVLNMLNLKYIIMDPNSMPLTNPYANGNAWLIERMHIAENADEEMLLLGEIDTKTELVVDKQFADMLPQQLAYDSTAQITLVSYKPNHLTYGYHAEKEQVAVFSEIYYDKGWNAYVAGEKLPYFRANYLLRAMKLKPGNYQIELKFEPNSYRIGNIIALTSSILLILCILAFFFLSYRKSTKSKQ